MICRAIYGYYYSRDKRGYAILPRKINGYWNNRMYIDIFFRFQPVEEKSLDAVTSSYSFYLGPRNQ